MKYLKYLVLCYYATFVGACANENNSTSTSDNEIIKDEFHNIKNQKKEDTIHYHKTKVEKSPELENNVDCLTIDDIFDIKKLKERCLHHATSTFWSNTKLAKYYPKEDNTKYGFYFLISDSVGEGLIGTLLVKMPENIERWEYLNNYESSVSIELYRNINNSLNLQIGETTAVLDKYEIISQNENIKLFRIDSCLLVSTILNENGKIDSYRLSTINRSLEINSQLEGQLLRPMQNRNMD